MKNIKTFEQITEKKWIQEADKEVKKGKMHSLLGIADDKNITDVYKSGKKLAEDLLAKTSKKSAIKMLNFAFNTSKSDVFEKALKHLEKTDENYSRVRWGEKKDNIKEGDLIETIFDFKGIGLPIGSKGTVVQVLSDVDAYMVDFNIKGKIHNFALKNKYIKKSI